jgi:hypothetical protein
VKSKLRFCSQVDVLIALALSTLLSACASLPAVKHKEYSFPKERAFLGDVKRPYEALGLVRSKVNFQSLDPNREEAELCRNYYNKAVTDLFKFAKDKGGDAVIDVKSVVFLEDGRHELYPTPECSDDGMEGQILTQGIAVKWKKKPEQVNTPDGVL